MSIAWATVVLVVLLLPGFAFLWGFYTPSLVTREAIAITPLGQLAAVVLIGFFVHAAAYAVINSRLGCFGHGRLGAMLPCIDIDQLAALLRIDGALPARPGLRGLGAMFDVYAAWILAYFTLVAAVSFVLGLGSGKLVERGTIPLTRHRYLFMLEEGRRAGERRLAPAGAARLVRAHVLSRTAHDRWVLIYDGVLRDFFAKADGTISYVVLCDAHSGALEIAEDGPRRGPFSAALEVGAKAVVVGTSFLVLTSDDIANVYFEHLSPVTKSADEERALDAALQRYEDSIGAGTG